MCLCAFVDVHVYMHLGVCACIQCHVWVCICVRTCVGVCMCMCENVIIVLYKLYINTCRAQTDNQNLRDIIGGMEKEHSKSMNKIQQQYEAKVEKAGCFSTMSKDRCECFLIRYVKIMLI